jgi:hypothetical protein
VDVPVTLTNLRAFSEVPVDPTDGRYATPLKRDTALLARVIPQPKGPSGETPKRLRSSAVRQEIAKNTRRISHANLHVI